MARQLRGLRYYTRPDDPRFREFKEFIEHELFNLDYDEARDFYASLEWLHQDLDACALLGCNDRFFLLTGILGREDLNHPWIYNRAREVETEPDGHVDLWARYHTKSSLVTCGGIIQEVLIDPELTVSIFSVTKPLAQAFLGQIKQEFENNDFLKAVYPDVLYENPRTLGKDGRPAKWSLQRGVTVKRKGNSKEATIEAHGLIDGQPTGRHFDMHVYDDVVTQDYISQEQIKKTTERWEMADNLGTRHGVRKWIVGTRYHFADTYGTIIDRGSAKPRIYPATDDGTLDGKPVLLSQERWDKIKNDQRSTVSAQMLLNPLAGGEATFKSVWLRTYDIVPAVMNVYVLVDPSKGTGERSDRTAIAVIGVDPGGNKYLLDGVRHRMKLSDRWEFIKQFKRKWETHLGVQMVRVGYERYGQVTDVEVIQDMMQRENNQFEIVELNTPRQGGHSKKDRIERLEPDFRMGRFYLPSVAHHADFGGACYWYVWTQELDDAAKRARQDKPYQVGQIVYYRQKGLRREMERCQRTAQNHRIVTAIKRKDENGDVYDLTRCLIEEMIRHPFATHDDLIDVTSRIYDIDPIAPTPFEAQSTEPIGLDRDEQMEADLELTATEGRAF